MPPNSAHECVVTNMIYTVTGTAVHDSAWGCSWHLASADLGSGVFAVTLINPLGSKHGCP